MDSGMASTLLQEVGAWVILLSMVVGGIKETIRIAYKFPEEKRPVNGKKTEDAKNNLKFISYRPSRGKSYAINRGVESALGDILVFTDCTIS